jgi:hypothetical protein
VSASAACVTPSSTQRLVSASSVIDVRDKSATATCPSPTVPYGVSGGVDYPGGVRPTYGVVIRSLTLAGGTASIQAQWMVSATTDWYAYVKVICA